MATKKPTGAGMGIKGKRAKVTGPSRTALSLDDQAAMLVEATLIGDEAAAEKYGISRRSVTRYRGDLRQGGELAERVHYRMQQLAEADDWANDASEAIREALAYIKRVCRETEYLGPDMLEAVTGALAILVDAKIAMQLIEASVNAQRAANDGAPAAADSKDAAPLASGSNGWGTPAFGSA